MRRVLKTTDKSCRNNGSCPWCRDNRLYKTNKRLEAAKYELREFEVCDYCDPWICEACGCELCEFCGMCPAMGHSDDCKKDDEESD